MSSWELLLWQRRYATGELLGAAREDLRSAQIASTIANYAGRSLPEDEFRTIESFILYSKPEPELSEEEAAERLQAKFAVAAQRLKVQPLAAKIQEQEEVSDGARSRNGNPLCS